VAGGPHEYHWFECEDPPRVGALVRAGDPGASAGAYVHVPSPPAPTDWSWNAAAPGLPPDRLERAITLSRGGTYVLWVRVFAPSRDEDAWYAAFDKTDLRRFYPVAVGAWTWTRTAGQDDPLRLRFTGLAPGARLLILGRGESGVRCDRALLTSDLAFVP
jgi:hypothetical protein